MNFFLLMDNDKPTTFLAFSLNEDAKEIQSIIDHANKYWSEHEEVRESYNSERLLFVIDCLYGRKKRFRYYNFTDKNILNL